MVKVSNKVIGFSGRIPMLEYRPKFFAMMTVNLVSGVFLKSPMGGAGGENNVIVGLMAIFFLFSLLSIISLFVRRFRDIKISLWWLIAVLSFFIMIYVVGIILCFKKGKYEDEDAAAAGKD